MFRDDKLTKEQLGLVEEADDHADRVYLDGPDEFFQEQDELRAVIQEGYYTEDGCFVRQMTTSERRKYGLL